MSSPNGDAGAPPTGMWGTSLRQRLRLFPLYAAITLADIVAPLVPGRTARREPWRDGISVVIPERDAADLLRTALRALDLALARIDEPRETIVVVNGAPLEAYAAIAQEWPEVRFLHHDAPLGFASAIALGLAHARHPGTLLLNNDMQIAPDAVAALAAQRRDDVFAIGAQIFQQSRDGRREETGLTDWYVDGDGVHLFHGPVPADDAAEAVPSLCASGGAALFRTRELTRYVQESRGYDPFYWEDAEWSVRAWREGWRVMFAPAAHVRHAHRATTARFYTAEALARIIERNRLLFDMRQGITPESRSALMRRICDLPYASQRDLSRIDVARDVLRLRAHKRRRPQPLAAPALWLRSRNVSRLPQASYTYRLREGASRPALLLVTPFAVYPPRHGGARRVSELVQQLRADYDVVLVSDEAGMYDARSFAAFDGLAGVYLVHRVDRSATSATAPMDARMQAHAHAGLRSAVRTAIAMHRPAIVQVEHAELASLVEDRDTTARWVLGLHDACRPEDFSTPGAHAAFERLLDRFDAVTVCSAEDASLVRHAQLVAVPNGSSVALGDYRPSVGHRLLFVGPFRYAPNAKAIASFLRDVYERIRRRVPDVELMILAGDEGPGGIANDPLFARPGVTVLGHRDDVPQLLRECTLTINPLTGIRGSAVKLVESLSAGRVCVSTREGARGFDAASFRGLVIVDDVAAMAEPIVELLLDPAARHDVEKPDAERLVPFQWSSCARIQRALYDRLLQP